MENTQTGLDDVELCKAKSDALRLLAFRPRSIAELKSRLKRKRFSQNIVDRAIDLLVKQGLLNDEKFAKLLTQSRLGTRPAGKKRLEAEMRQKGISRDIVEKAISSVSDQEEHRAAWDLVFRRFQKMKGVTRQKKKARLYGLLRRRGFSQNVIFSVLDELFAGQTDDLPAMDDAQNDES